jgi:hypothetical protein
MGRKPKKDQSTDIGVGHVPFPLAVQLASSELLQDPRIRHSLNAVGNALARVVPVYFQGAGVDKPRPLSEGELEGSQVVHRATVLLLKDGRRLSAVSVKRRDLRRAIALLRSAGIPQLAQSSQKPEIQSREISATLAEIERLVSPPLLPSQLDRANALAASIARAAPDPGIAHLAMRLLSAVHDARTAGDSADNQGIKLLLARMRDAIGDKNNA